MILVLPPARNNTGTSTRLPLVLMPCGVLVVVEDTPTARTPHGDPTVVTTNVIAPLGGVLLPVVALWIQADVVHGILAGFGVDVMLLPAVIRGTEDRGKHLSHVSLRSFSRWVGGSLEPRESTIGFEACPHSQTSPRFLMAIGSKVFDLLGGPPRRVGSWAVSHCRTLVTDGVTEAAILMARKSADSGLAVPHFLFDGIQHRLSGRGWVELRFEETLGSTRTGTSVPTGVCHTIPNLRGCHGQAVGVFTVSSGGRKFNRG